MHYPKEDTDNKTAEIIEEILYIQRQPYMNWISALGRKVRVESLHQQLDDMGYAGDRPPRSWNQFRVGKNLEK